MQVDTANSGASALIAIQKACEQLKPYDVALINMQMPNTDAMTLIGNIQANSALCKIPLILLTSTHQRHELQQAKNIGFAAYLVKPVKASRLLDTILNLLDNQLSIIESLPDISKPQQIDASTTSKLRILLAEDNVVNQKVALKLLQSLGYKADVVANGQEVLQVLEKIPYDLILMDCQMPILDGLETTKEIRRWHQSRFANHCHPVVIALTANAMSEYQQICLDAGMDDYLSKPVIKEKLRVMLERWHSRNHIISK